VITTKDVSGPLKIDDVDKTVLHLVANNGTRANYSLFALNLREIPQTVALHGRIYERAEGNEFREQAPPKFTTTAQFIPSDDAGTSLADQLARPKAKK